MRARYTVFLLTTLLLFIAAEYFLLTALYNHFSGGWVALAGLSVITSVALLLFCYRKLCRLYN